MSLSRRIPSALRALLLCLVVLAPAAARSEPRIGIVLLHGKGATSTSMEGLAGALTQKGYLVANLTMPWSGTYETDVLGAMHTVDAALHELRSRGAAQVFVAGHSQGGVFALRYGVRHTVTGIVAIAPGGNVGNAAFRDKLSEYVDEARKLIAEGKGDEKTRFYDVDPGAGRGYGIVTTPAIYLSWFSPDGAMNEYGAAKKMNPATPVLFIAPTGDMPGLKRGNPQIFSLLPRNSHTEFYEPASSHTQAPNASAEEIARWMAEVAAAAHP
ncbi:MAG: alpha/beta hydrolase [Bordetella sp.]|uniref:alpha/beta hydrolase n=1 Tax=Bordetella sp. TaxID=28081 RepID=UPI003F7C9502